MATTIYRGSGWSADAVGEIRDGTVYRGTGWSADAIGEYKDGSIYQCKDDTIYRGYDLDGRAIGRYDSTWDEGVCAGAFLLLAADLL